MGNPHKQRAMKSKSGCTTVHPLLLSPRSKACCGVCRAYESGGGGQPQTQRNAFGQPLKAEPAPAGAGARGCGPSARPRGGGFRAVAPVARPLRRPGPHSLSCSRRCPHFMAPGRPAPGLRSKGATACGRWWGLPSGPLGRPSRPQRPAGRSPARPGRLVAARPGPALWAVPG